MPTGRSSSTSASSSRDRPVTGGRLARLPLHHPPPGLTPTRETARWLDNPARNGPAHGPAGLYVSCVTKGVHQSRICARFASTIALEGRTLLFESAGGRDETLSGYGCTSTAA